VDLSSRLLFPESRKYRCRSLVCASSIAYFETYERTYCTMGCTKSTTRTGGGVSRPEIQKEFLWGDKYLSTPLPDLVLSIASSCPETIFSYRCLPPNCLRLSARSSRTSIEASIGTEYNVSTGRETPHHLHYLLPASCAPSTQLAKTAFCRSSFRFHARQNVLRLNREEKKYVGGYITRAEVSKSSGRDKYHILGSRSQEPWSGLHGRMSCTLTHIAVFWTRRPHVL
jgi:hypothetical protein